MAAQLPIVKIADTDFFVDLRGMQFVEVGDPKNKISFDDVHDSATQCTILYDTATKNVFQGSWAEFRQSGSTREVQLPALAELDPPTLAAIILEKSLDDPVFARAAKALQKITEQKISTIKSKKSL